MRQPPQLAIPTSQPLPNSLQAKHGRGMDDHQTPASSNSSSNSGKTAELDNVLHSMGFEIQEVSPSQLTGRLPVTERCCQPFKVLHGGVSALVSEGMASMGAHMASGYRRVAGVHLSINHFRSATIGDVVLARAAPVHLGRSTQRINRRLEIKKLWTESRPYPTLSTPWSAPLPSFPNREHQGNRGGGRELMAELGASEGTIGCPGKALRWNPTGTAISWVATAWWEGDYSGGGGTVTVATTKR